MDNGSLRAYKDQLQTGDQDDSSDDEDVETSSKAVRLSHRFLGSNTIPLGSAQRKAFNGEVKLSSQTRRILGDFFEYAGPKLQYKPGASKIDDDVAFLKAVPRPRTSSKMPEAFVLTKTWGEKTDAEQIGRKGTIDRARQEEIDALWERQKGIR